MRCTQFIGLNNAAKAFVSGFTRLADDPEMTYGMFDEPIAGGLWEDPVTKLRFREVEQVSLWSSGPMIFTCIVREERDEKLFEWKEDQSVSGEEYDPEKGLYWV